jgi:hypothetical protein
MGDGDISIDRTRRRDWTLDVDDGAAPSPPENATRAAKDATAAAKLTAWIQSHDGPAVPLPRVARDGTPVRSPAPGEGHDDDTYTMSLSGVRARPCSDYDKPGFDFDRCVIDRNPGKPGDPPKASTLFLPESRNEPPIAHKDVNQRYVGDCALMASLAGLATTPEGREWIHSAIGERKNEKGEVTGYTVRLYEVQGPPDGPRTFRRREFVVPANEPYVMGHAVARGDATHYEIWPLVMEKAYAQLRDGYNRLSKGEHVLDAMEALTGREAWHVPAAEASDRLIWADLEAHKVVVLSTKKGLGANPYNLESEHAYTVTRRVDADGKRVLTLYNPWGTSQPEPIPSSEISKWFDCLDIGSPGGTP